MSYGLFVISCVSFALMRYMLGYRLGFKHGRDA